MNPSPSDLVSGISSESTSDEPAGFDPELLSEQILADPHLVQHLVRTRQDGVEAITAFFRCEFSPGQQRYVLHVPFSPAFPGIPVVHATVSEREDVRVRITDNQKFGARLEVVLPHPAKSANSLIVEVIATRTI